MNKYLQTLYTLIIALFFVTPVFAQSESKPYLIFVHEDCPHCKNVEKFVSDNDLGEFVEYKELKNKPKVLNELEDIWDEYNVEPSDQGWPFMLYVDEKGSTQYAVGDSPIIDYIAGENSIDTTSVYEDVSSTDTPQSDSGSNTLLLAVGGIFLLAVVGYGIYSMFDKSE